MQTSQLVRVIEAELLPIAVFHCGNKDFLRICSHHRNLDLMTFIYELDPYSLEMHQMSENELPMSSISKVIV